MAAFTGDVDGALVAKLLADAPLMALMPDGVWWDVSGSGKTRVVIVKLMSHTVEQRFGGKAYEMPVYLVKAVELTKSSANAQAAARRIDAMLDGGTLAPTGYSLMTMQLEEEVHYQEADPDNADARWQHWGGMYSVWVSPT
jgi:hypothetical protein